MVRRILSSAVALTLAAIATGPPAGAWAATPGAPDRVMIVIVDQFRPDYVERFNMSNVRGLMNEGANFERAVLGHMAAETVISHNVITSGLFPKRMGWSNEVFRDVDNVLGGGAGAYHVTSSLACGDFKKLLEAGGYPKLDDDLGGKFIAVGQKGTAACTAGHPADPSEDIVVHMGSRNADCDGDGTKNWRRPAGANLPAYITAECGRFFVDADKNVTYGTAATSPAWMYPLDGNRFALGNYVGDDGLSRDHLGGDAWTTNAAISMMSNEPDWKGMLVSLGSVDKAAHMWGTDDTGPSHHGEDQHDQAHLPFAVKTADELVGKLMQALDEQGLRDETLVVLTTDHGGQTAKTHHGINLPNRGDFNWYYGQDADETYKNPQPQLQPLLDTGKVAFNYQDAHIASWLNDTSDAAKRTAAEAMRRLPDVIAAYRRVGDRYVQTGTPGAMNKTERAWWQRYGQTLVNTMASPSGPDVVGLLRDDVSYGVAGDHGGHQKAIQRIPMVFSWPGLQPQTRQEEIRAVDILPTVLDLMKLPRASRHSLDGQSYKLEHRPR